MTAKRRTFLVLAMVAVAALYVALVTTLFPQTEKRSISHISDTASGSSISLASSPSSGGQGGDAVSGARLNNQNSPPTIISAPTPAPVTPSPPTPAPTPAPTSLPWCSSRPQVCDSSWDDMHKTLVEEATTLKSAIRLLFLGDSITETWRGTSRGRQCDRCAGVNGVWRDKLVKYNPAAFGIAGDTTEQLLWRVRHGELTHLEPKAIVLLIGTNDVALGATAEEVYAGIMAVVSELRRALPQSILLLMALFPRGAKSREPALPNEFSGAIDSVNYKLADFVKQQEHEIIRFVDCNKHFIVHKAGGKMELDVSLFPDVLHPNVRGHSVWAECLKPHLDLVMQPGYKPKL